MSEDSPRAITFIDIEPGVFFRLKSRTLKYPGLLVAIFDGDLPEDLSSDNPEDADTDVLFKVTDVNLEKNGITVEIVDCDIDWGTEVVPTRELPVGIWVTQMYSVDEKTKTRTIGIVTEDNTFMPGNRKGKRKRRGGRKH